MVAKKTKKKVRKNLGLETKAEVTKEIIMAHVRDNYEFDFPKPKNQFEHISDAVIVGELAKVAPF